MRVRQPGSEHSQTHTRVLQMGANRHGDTNTSSHFFGHIPLHLHDSAEVKLLKSSDKKLQDVHENMQDAICEVDTRGEIFSLNIAGFRDWLNDLESSLD